MGAVIADLNADMVQGAQMDQPSENFTVKKKWLALSRQVPSLQISLDTNDQFSVVLLLSLSNKLPIVLNKSSLDKLIVGTKPSKSLISQYVTPSFLKFCVQACMTFIRDAYMEHTTSIQLHSVENH